MPRRVVAALAAVLITLLAGPSVASAQGPSMTGTAAVVAGAPPTDPPVVTDNAFIPEGKDLSECVSAAPEPGCGSEDRGGWRQAVVFGIVVVALAFVGWRIVRTVRRNRQVLESTGGR